VCDQPARVCPPCSLRIAHGVCTQPITNQCQCCCVAGHAAVGPLWFGQCTRPVDLTWAHAGSCCGSAIGCAGRQVASTLSATTVRGIAVQPVAWAVQVAGIAQPLLPPSLPPSLAAVVRAAVILRGAAGVGERNLSVKTRVRYLAAVPLTAANAVAWYAVSEALQPFPVACSVGQMLGRSYRGARWTQARAGWDSELAEALGAGAAPNFRGGLPARSTLLHVATANGHVSTPCACAACMAVELTAAWRRSAACESCCVMSTTNIAMRWT